MLRQGRELNPRRSQAPTAADAFIGWAAAGCVAALFVGIAGLAEHQQLDRDLLVISLLVMAPLAILRASHLAGGEPRGL
jgi:hypothetical protein